MKMLKRLRHVFRQNLKLRKLKRLLQQIIKRQMKSLLNHRVTDRLVHREIVQ
jgi:hypothetical protein